MAPTHEPTTVARSRILHLSTQDPIQLVDITEAVANLVREAGVVDGQALVLSRHTTAAVRIQENEPLLLEDLRAFLSRLAPDSDPYHHNDFDRRTEHMHPGESPNGHSHCLQLLLGSSESVPIMDGRLLLGSWQRLFLVELDGPRAHREVLVQVLGLAAPRAEAAEWPTRLRHARPSANLRLMSRAGVAASASPDHGSAA